MRRNRRSTYVVAAFEYLYPASGASQVRSSHQAVVPAADDDSVQRAFCHVIPVRSALVTFDLVGPTGVGQSGILSGFAERAALPQQVPTLVEGHFQ